MNFFNLPIELKQYYLNVKDEEKKLLKAYNKAFNTKNHQNIRVNKKNTNNIFTNKNIFSNTIVDGEHKIINNDIYKNNFCPIERIITQIGFKSFENLIKSLKLDLNTLKQLNNTFKNKKVFKIILTPIMLEKLSLERLFYKNDLNLNFKSFEYSFATFENFFNLNDLYHNINFKRSNFLLDSVIVLKRQLTKDGLKNILFVNSVVLRQIKKLLKSNKLYGKNKNDFKGLYNVVNRIDNNHKHLLLNIEDINFNILYNKDNIDYTTLEKVENFYFNLKDLKTKEKLLLLEKIKEYEKKEHLNYINNLTFNNLKSYYNDYDNYNYKGSYKGLKLKDIKINTNNKKDYLSYYNEFLRHLKRLYL